MKIKKGIARITGKKYIIKENNLIFRLSSMCIVYKNNNRL